MLLWKPFQPLPKEKGNKQTVILMHSVEVVLISILFGVIGFYLTLISKFYREKFQKGPPYRYLQISLSVLVVGILLQLKAFEFLPQFISQGFICLGGVVFAYLGYSLYKTMMSIS